jgi:hypothetical protein
LRVLGVLPGVTIPVFAVTAVWMLAAMVVAVRQALDYQSTARAIAVCASGGCRRSLSRSCLAWCSG